MRRIHPRAQDAVNLKDIAAGLAGLGVENLLAYLENALAVAQEIVPANLATDLQDGWREHIASAQDAIGVLRQAHPTPEARSRLLVRASAGEVADTLTTAIGSLSWLGRALAMSEGVTPSPAAIWRRRRSATRNAL